MAEAEGAIAEAEVSAVSGEEQEDARLIAELRQGRPGAYVALYDRYSRRLLRFLAWRLHGDVATAEELMVHTFAEAVRGFSHYDPRRARLLVWLFGIAARQAQEEVRRRHRRKSVPEKAQLPLTAMTEEALAVDPTGALAARVEAQRQVALLQRYLTPLELEALWLHGAYEMSAREIGQVWGKSERAISSLLHRARTKARERLANDARTD